MVDGTAFMSRFWRTVLFALVGLGLGVGLGLAAGWLWWPVEYTDTEIADLTATHQADYVLLVSDAYALTGDLDAARLRLSRLGAPDAAALVLARAQAALAKNAPAERVSRLAHLAAALGATSPEMEPYLEPSSTAP
jgi:hypothetical protein